MNIPKGRRGHSCPPRMPPLAKLAPTHANTKTFPDGRGHGKFTTHEPAVRGLAGGRPPGESSPLPVSAPGALLGRGRSLPRAPGWMLSPRRPAAPEAEPAQARSADRRSPGPVLTREFAPSACTPRTPLCAGQTQHAAPQKCPLPARRMGSSPLFWDSWARGVSKTQTGVCPPDALPMQTGSAWPARFRWAEMMGEGEQSCLWLLVS